MATLSFSVSGSAIGNGTKSYTVSDADLQSFLNWAASAFASNLPSTPTNPQIFSAWADFVVGHAKNNIQRFQTVAPAPITIA